MKTNKSEITGPTGELKEFFGGLDPAKINNDIKELQLKENEVPLSFPNPSRQGVIIVKKGNNRLIFHK